MMLGTITVGAYVRVSNLLRYVSGSLRGAFFKKNKSKALNSKRILIYIFNPKLYITHHDHYLNLIVTKIYIYALDYYDSIEEKSEPIKGWIFAPCLKRRRLRYLSNDCILDGFIGMAQLSRSNNNWWYLWVKTQR